MGTTVNGKDILYTIANNITQVTLSPGAAGSGGATSKGQELNAYAKAYKIITENEAYIDAKGGTDTAVGDVIEEIFFSHQFAGASPYTTGTGGSYGGTVATTTGVNAANGFNALFMANAIDQFRQADGVTASTIGDAGTTVDSFPYRLIQAQGSSAMTITLQNSAGATPTATAGINIPFRIKSGTAAASLKLGRTEYGSAVAATTLTLDSGATLGMTNNGGDTNVQSTLYIYAINDAGTIKLGIINGQRLDESILHTSTALDGTADSASILYSDSAITSCAVRLIGRMRHSMNAVGTYDEDPIELGILGVGGGGTASGELAAGEKIYWQDTNQYIHGDLTSITIEADDNFVVNTDTLAQLNSTTKVDLVAPTTNVVSTTAFDANTPSFIIRSATAQKPVVDIQNDGNDATGPILRLINNRSGAGADDDQAGRIEFHSKDDGTPSDFIVAQQFANVADATSGSKDGLWSLQVMSNQTLTNRIIADSAGVAVTGTLTVSGDLTISGTTTTINSTVSTLKDPIFELGTDDDGAAPGSDDNKDRGLLLHYFSGTAKTAFMGWDESAAEFAFAATSTLASEALNGTQVYGQIHTGNIKINDGATIGTATDVDAITIAAAGVVTFSQSPVIGGATPKLTIGDAGAEDTMLVFDGNATDIRMGIDDSSDLFEIGTGATHTTTPAITIDTAQNVDIVAHDATDQGLKLAGTLVTSTAAEINLLDGGTSASPTYTIIDADRLVVNDGGTMKCTLMSDLKTYAGFTGALAGADVDLSALSSGNNANTTLILGSTTSECLNVTANNVTGAATLSSVNFITKTASTGSNIGQMTFSVDEATAQLTINDAGITATAITESSDTELKTNITPLEGSLDKIMALQGVNFDWKEGQENQIGLLADDVAKIVPEFVQFEKRGRKKKAVALQYSKMVALLIEGMKEQQQEINELKRLIPKT